LFQLLFELLKLLRSRCQILLALDEAHGKSLTLVQCAKSIGVCKATVSNTIKDYADAGFNQAITYNRNVNSDNARRKLDGRAEAKFIQIACGPVPEGHSRWTLRFLEEKAKVELEIPINKETIRTALKKRTSTSPQQLLVHPSKRKCKIRSRHGRHS